MLSELLTTDGKASYRHNDQPAVMPKKDQLPPGRLDNKEFVELEAPMKDAIKRILTAGSSYPSSSVFVLVLGDNILIPERDIKGVEFQLLGIGQQPLLFEWLGIRVASTTGEVTDCEREYQHGGWVGRFVHLPENGGKRAYMAGLRVDGARPTALRVRLTEAGGDECPALLTELTGDLVTGVASGTDWQEWRIPATAGDAEQ